MGLSEIVVLKTAAVRHWCRQKRSVSLDDVCSIFPIGDKGCSAKIPTGRSTFETVVPFPFVVFEAHCASFLDSNWANGSRSG